jgi:hypothetical protein
LQDNDPGISEENRRQTRKHLSGRIAVDASISHASVYAARLQLPLEMGGIRLAARNTLPYVLLAPSARISTFWARAAGAAASQAMNSKADHVRAVIVSFLISSRLYGLCLLLHGGAENGNVECVHALTKDGASVAARELSKTNAL